jgi:hypothetical protein
MLTIGIIAETKTTTSGIDSNTIITILSSIVTVLISAIVSYVVAKSQSQTADRQALARQVDDLLHITLEYPHLDSESFVEKWKKGEGTFEDRDRYTSFCCFAFNLLYRVWQFHRGDAKKIDDVILAREIVHRHKTWWLGDANNTLAYDEKFAAYIRSLT